MRHRRRRAWPGAMAHRRRGAGAGTPAAGPGSRSGAAGFVGTCSQRPPTGTPPTSRGGESGGLDAKLDRLARLLQPLTQAANRFRKWRKCISHVPVSELRGSQSPVWLRLRRARRHRTRSASPALTVDYGSRGPAGIWPSCASQAASGCNSAAVVPGGTAEPARALARPPARAPGPSGRARRRRAAAEAAPARPGSGRSNAGCSRLERRADSVESGRRALRRVGVLSLLGAGDRIRRPRRLVRLPLPRPVR